MTPTAQADLAAETLLQGRYQIIRRIGQGGMGAVFEAIDTRLGHLIAIKQTAPTPADPLLSPDDDPLRRAFEREARILASLRHPALPVVSDFFSEDDAQYLVMQYIPGDDLWTLLQRNGTPFPIADVLAWADRLLEVLDYLHTNEPPILHRDIKPQNLKLTPRGEIILLDFGLARGATTMHSRLSTGGSLVAYTPQYAPMEQIRGLSIGARSDLYALAATLHHLLTGRLPASAMDRAAAAMEGRPDPLIPVHQVNPLIPPEVGALLTRAMAPRVEERPANAAAMRVALRRAYRPSRQIATTPASAATPDRTAPESAGQPVPEQPASHQPAPTPLRDAAALLARSAQTALHALSPALHRAYSRAIALRPHGIALHYAARQWRYRREAMAGVAVTFLLGAAIIVPRPPLSTPAITAASTVTAAPAITAAPRPAEAPTATAADPEAQRGYERAIETLSAAIAVRPDDARNYTSRAEAYLALGDAINALADYQQALALSPDDVTIYLDRAAAYRTQRNYSRAIDDYTQALTRDSTLAPALTGRAEALLAQGNPSAAIADYDRLLKIRPDDAAAYLGRGIAYLQAREHRKAIADFDRAAAIRPNDADAYIQRGLAYVSLGEYDRATDDYSQAIRLEPARADSYLNRGRAAFYQRAYERAIADYNRFLQLNPDSAVGFYNRGLAYSARGEQERAIDDFDAYIRQRPDDPDIYLYRALAYSRLGLRDAAAEDLRRCLRLSNDPELTAQAEQQLRLVTQG